RLRVALRENTQKSQVRECTPRDLLASRNWSIMPVAKIGPQSPESRPAREEAMPTVINGIGTWYYGKRHVHRHKATCGFCHNMGELESYDTTLFFVFVFVPIIPLGKKRILEACPYCRKHRAMPLRKWKASKKRDTEELLQQLRASPDDRSVML